MYAIGNDHSAVALKEIIKAHLESKGIEVKDFGTESTTASNYAAKAEEVANAVASGECERGILICGTGIGMSIVANKVKGIRCALCDNLFSAEMTRRHNNSNMLSMGARVISNQLALKIVDMFLDTPFEGGRHQRRVEKLMAIENE